MPPQTPLYTAALDKLLAEGKITKEFYDSQKSAIAADQEKAAATGTGSAAENEQFKPQAFSLSGNQQTAALFSVGEESSKLIENNAAYLNKEFERRNRKEKYGNASKEDIRKQEERVAKESAIAGMAPAEFEKLSRFEQFKAANDGRLKAAAAKAAEEAAAVQKRVNDFAAGDKYNTLIAKRNAKQDEIAVRRKAVQDAQPGELIAAQMTPYGRIETRKRPVLAGYKPTPDAQQAKLNLASAPPSLPAGAAPATGVGSPATYTPSGVWAANTPTKTFTPPDVSSAISASPPTTVFPSAAALGGAVARAGANEYEKQQAQQRQQSALQQGAGNMLGAVAQGVGAAAQGVKTWAREFAAAAGGKNPPTTPVPAATLPPAIDNKEAARQAWAKAQEEDERRRAADQKVLLAGTRK